MRLDNDCVAGHIKRRRVVAHGGLVVLIGRRIAHLPIHTARDVFGVIKMNGEIAGGSRVDRQGTENQLLRLRQRYALHLFGRRHPARQRFLEDGQGAGVEGDE